MIRVLSGKNHRISRWFFLYSPIFIECSLPLYKFQSNARIFVEADVVNFLTIKCGGTFVPPHFFSFVSITLSVFGFIRFRCRTHCHRHFLLRCPRLPPQH